MSLRAPKNDPTVKNPDDDGMNSVEGKLAESIRPGAGTIDGGTFASYKAGEPDGMLTVVRAYQHRLIGFIRLYTQSRELAEEIAQEVFLDAYRQRDDIYAADSLRPWLFTLAKRKAIRELGRRHYSAEIHVDTDVFHLAAPPVEPEQGRALLTDEVRGILAEALAELKPVERELVSLRYFGDLPIKEIAEVLKMPMGSVGVKLGRALAKLRTALERRGFRLDDLFPSP